MFYCFKVSRSAALHKPPSYLLVGEFFAWVGLLWVVEPVDSDHHVAAPGLPHALDASDEGQVGSAGGQEHGTVADADHLSASNDGLVEELLSLALHTTSLQEAVESQCQRKEDQNLEKD